MKTNLLKKSNIKACFAGAILCFSSLFSEEITQGEKHSAVLSGSNLQTWGDNSFGQLGHNNSIDYVTGSHNWISISSDGFHNIALDDQLMAWAWGRNESGQLGLGDKVDRSTPTLISTPEPIIEIEAGPRNSYLIGVSGNLYSVGNGSNDLLGYSSVEETTFNEVILSEKVISVSASDTLALCVDETGSVWAWGENGFSQTPGTATPSLIAIPEEICQVKAGSFHALALSSSGNLYGWGKNTTQQLGPGNAIEANPILIETDVIDFDAGREHSLILTATGLKAIGRNQVSQLGSSDSASIQEDLSSVVNTKITNSGAYENIIINSQANLIGWGLNDQDQIHLPQNIVSTPQDLGISIPLSFKSHSKLTAFSAGNINLNLEVLSMQGHTSQTSTIFAPFSANVSNSSTLNPNVEIGIPGTYVFLTEITQAGQTYKRIVKLFVKPATYGGLIWGQNSWNQGHETTLDLR